MGRGQQGQACVTTVSDRGENDAEGQTIVVIGGEIIHSHMNSIFVSDPSTMELRHGPSLYGMRSDFVAADKVYAIGRFGDDYNHDNYKVWGTIESIQVSSLVEMTETRQNNIQGIRLQCHLSSP